MLSSNNLPPGVNANDIPGERKTREGEEEWPESSQAPTECVMAIHEAEVALTRLLDAAEDAGDHALWCVVKGQLETLDAFAERARRRGQS